MPSTVKASARRQRRNQLLSKRLRECFLQNRLHLDSKHQTRFCSCAWMHNVNTQRVPPASVSGRSIFIQIYSENTHASAVTAFKPHHGAEAGMHFLRLCHCAYFDSKRAHKHTHTRMHTHTHVCKKAMTSSADSATNRNKGVEKNLKSDPGCALVTGLGGNK